MLIDVCMVLYVLVTINTASQLAIVARLEQGPRARGGNISDMISQGTGPQARAKNRLNKTIQTMASQFIFDAGTEWLMGPNREATSEDEFAPGGGMQISKYAPRPKRVQDIAIDIVNKRTRRPVLSITKHAKLVPKNWTKPTEMLTSLLSVKPATAKILAALNTTAVIPDSCWKIINPMLIIKGFVITGDNQSGNESFSS